MSGKTVILRYSEKDGGWVGHWGNETFYDRDRFLITWSTPEHAKRYLAIYHPHLIVTVEGEQPPAKLDHSEQPKLF